MLKRMIPVILSMALLAASVVYVSDRQIPMKESEAESAPSVLPEQPDVMRGVWVTYMTLNVENESDRETAFKSRIDGIISDMLSSSLNTMIVQVRPFCDAVYPSKYFPWSHILTGTQGEDPGYDPLEYIVTQAHENGIAVHAWINPYRISSEQQPDALCDDSPYVRDPSIGTKVNGSLYLNPASDKAQELIVKGVEELVARYAVDGVQFDDYFYPPDCGDCDAEEYAAYSENTDSPLSLEDFRKENVSKLIKAVYEAVHNERDIPFGVSPQGNIGNNEGIYADVVRWCEEDGYLDYICPQLYYSTDNPALKFEDALDQWQAIRYAPNVRLYIGLPAYKAGTDADSGTWLDNDEILLTEVKILEERGIGGFMLYSYDSLHNEDNAPEVENVIRYLTTSPTQ